MRELKMNVANTDDFSDRAIEELTGVFNEYSTSIINECNRLAASEALDGKPSEITAAIVRKANTVFQISNGLDTSPRPSIWLRIFSAVLPVVTGVVPNLVDMTKGGNLAIVAILAAASIILIVVLLMKDFAK
jgi:hypothetical protein